MLPRRKILGTLPRSICNDQHLVSTSTARSLRSTISNGRQFGTSRTGALGPAMMSGRRIVSASASLGPMFSVGATSSTRSFSLWGYGSSKSAEVTSPSAVPEPSLAETKSATTASGSAPVDPIVSQPPPDLANAPAETELSSISNFVEQHESILNMPEHIGYLKSLGLDYGWGPASVMQWVIEHIHVYTGLGWGGSIVATAFLVRAVMFYPHIASMINNARMQVMRQDPRFDESTNMIKSGQANRNMAEMQKGQYLGKKLREEYNVAVMKSFYGLLPIPFTFGMFRVITGMGKLPVPSYEHAGFAWFTDLSASDPYFLLPLGAVGFMIAGMRVMNKYTPKNQQALLKPMMYVLGPVMALATSFLSAGVNLMGVAFGAATLIQAAVLNIPSIRFMLGIPTPKMQPPPGEIPSSANATYQAPRKLGLQERLMEQLNESKKGLNTSVGNLTGRYAPSEEEKAQKKRKEAIAKAEATRQKQEREEFLRKWKQ